MAEAKSTKPALPSATDTQAKRSLAKAGMAASLGVLVATGLMGTRKSPALKSVHLWSGIALVGLSYWHYSLYNKKPNGRGPA